MSRELDKARELVRADRLKQAVNALSEVAYERGCATGRGARPARSRNGVARSHGRDVARTMRGRDPAARPDPARRNCGAGPLATGSGSWRPTSKRDPGRLARWAREAGLTWLEVESTEDVAAAVLRQAIAKGRRRPYMPPPERA